MKHEGFTPGPWEAATADNLDQDGVAVYYRNKGGMRVTLASCRYLGTADPAPALANAALIAAAPVLLAENERLRDALKGCADALNEAGKDFAAGSKYYARPNLYDLHAEAARAALAGGSACQDCRETGFSACHHALAGGRG